MNRPAACALVCLSLFFAAAAPIAIQQAHFYTVDGVLERAVRLDPRLSAELESWIQTAKRGTGP